MSLAPSTDLVLEVSRAADPSRAAAVVDRLKALASDGAQSPADFAAALNAASSAAPAPTPVVATPLAALRPASPVSREQKARTQLEAAFLSQFIGEMLPKDAQSAYGQGYAGDMWRSMLAERVADQMAASGRLGIASRLFSGRPLASSDALMSPEKMRGLGQAQATQTSANALSSPSGADIVNGGFLFDQAESS
jgi:Rod binding domain-containing protein